jgi:hypothetical protein
MIQHSDTIGEIATALAKVAAAISNPSKNAANPHFRSKYADLAEIVNVSRELLAAHGVVAIQSPGMEDGLCTVDTLLTHTSGEWIRGHAAAPLQKNDPQGVGSAVTYLRRYALAGMLGLAQEDDDGNAASGPRPAPKAAPQRDSGPPPADQLTGEATEKQIAFAEKLIRSSALTDIERKDAEKYLASNRSKSAVSKLIDRTQTTIAERKGEVA